MIRSFRTATAAVLLACSSLPAPAQDCSSAVQSAQDNIRNSFIQGMSGLISNNFSARPSSFASMACLDKFMQGNMDIMFKPPTLTDLLGTVMNFACQQGRQAASGGGGGVTNFGGLIGSLAGGLNLGGAGGSGGAVNLSSILSGMGGGATAFGGSGYSGSAGNGGINGLYALPGR